MYENNSEEYKNSGKVNLGKVIFAIPFVTFLIYFALGIQMGAGFILDLEVLAYIVLVFPQLLLFSITLELVLVILYVTKFNSSNVSENLIHERQQNSFIHRIKVIVQILLFLIISVPVLMFVMSLVAKFTG